MACTGLVGYKSSACRLQGGIKDVYFGLSSDTEYVITRDGVTDEITSIGGGVGTEVELVKFTNLHNSGSAVETLEGDKWLSYTQLLTVVSRGFDAEALQSLNTLSKAEVFAVVHYDSGISRVYGMLDFLRPSGGEATSGEASGDANMFSIEFTGSEDESAPIVQGSAVGDPFGTMTGGIKVNGVVVTLP